MIQPLHGDEVALHRKDRVLNRARAPFTVAVHQIVFPDGRSFENLGIWLPDTVFGGDMNSFRIGISLVNLKVEICAHKCRNQKRFS